MNTKRISSSYITRLAPSEVFVFGSNLQGMHGGGATRMANKHFGAVWGQGVGLYGQSYAIPTMHGGVEAIKPYVDEFILFAKRHGELDFLVTEIGCGIAGFSVQEMAPLFFAAIEDNLLDWNAWDKKTRERGEKDFSYTYTVTIEDYNEIYVLSRNMLLDNEYLKENSIKKFNN